MVAGRTEKPLSAQKSSVSSVRDSFRDSDFFECSFHYGVPEPVWSIQEKVQDHLTEHAITLISPHEDVKRALKEVDTVHLQ